MQCNLLQRFLQRTGSAVFALVFASMPPAFADEATALPGVAPLPSLPDAKTVVVLPGRSPGWLNSPGLEFASGETGSGLRLGGLFFQASEGLQIGAQGSFNRGFGNLSAVFALRLEF
jgi:hypothetical protein